MPPQSQYISVNNSYNKGHYSSGPHMQRAPYDGKNAQNFRTKWNNHISFDVRLVLRKKRKF